MGRSPKLSFLWKKQQSNLASLYAYKDKQITIVLEKNF